jgi:hypothetical protein
MANAKSTRIIAVGVAVFVIGGALLFLVLGRSSTSTPKVQTAVSAPATTTTVPGSVYIPATPPTTIIQFKIPTGLNAVALPMDYFAGVGGFVRPGDVVNIYTLVNKDCATTTTPAGVKLILSNVHVLEVLGSPPAAAGAASSYLLALSPQDAEKAIFNAKFYGLYFTLTTGNEPAVSTTGISCSNAH